MSIVIHYIFVASIMFSGFISFLRLIYYGMDPKFFQKKIFSIVTNPPNKRQLITYNIITILACLDALYFIIDKFKLF